MWLLWVHLHIFQNSNYMQNKIYVERLIRIGNLFPMVTALVYYTQY